MTLTLHEPSARSNCHDFYFGPDTGTRLGSSSVAQASQKTKALSVGRPQGMVLGVAVVPANERERAGAKALLKPLLAWLPWLRKIWVDSGYSNPDFAQWVQGERPKLKIEAIKRSDYLRGFHVLPKRWIVERTFAWLIQNRRLVRDYEQR